MTPSTLLKTCPRDSEPAANLYKYLRHVTEARPCSTPLQTDMQSASNHDNMPPAYQSQFQSVNDASDSDKNTPPWLRASGKPVQESAAWDRNTPLQYADTQVGEA